MSTDGALMVRVSPAADGDDEELAGLTFRLRAELLQFEVDGVELAVPGTAALTGDDRPEDDRAKGIPGLAAAGHWLAVQLGALSLGTVLSAIGAWAARNNRTVEVTVGSSTLKLGRASADQQDKIINAWLASLPPGP